MEFDRNRVKQMASRMARQGVYLGTSSWKYRGWCGMFYDEQRYIHRGRFSETRFEKYCLAEYAEVFKTVCLDAAYYAFPTAAQLKALATDVPSDFRFGFKVTDEITVKKYPGLPRFGRRAGAVNENFLSAALFQECFLRPCEAIREQVGILIFEFSRFPTSEYATGAEFLADLDRFLAGLPAGWPYGVELRNRDWLGPDYFACLARHNVAHVFNSWTDMPSVSQQMAFPASRTSPGLTAARFLLKPGRTYENAVKQFQPYDKIMEPDEAARQAGAALILEGERYEPRRKTYIYVNNRLEGNALITIASILLALEQTKGPG